MRPEQAEYYEKLIAWGFIRAAVVFLAETVCGAELAAKIIRPAHEIKAARAALR
jgi:hypothetical protein